MRLSTTECRHPSTRVLNKLEARIEIGSIKTSSSSFIY